MIFFLSMSYFGFHCLCLWPNWITLTDPSFKIICEIMLVSTPILKSYKQGRKMNVCDRTNIILGS